MTPRKVADGVYSVGAQHPDRRMFDELIPLPDGTSYNAYLVRGSEKTALIDTVDPAKRDVLLAALAGVERIDYVISNHAEQDHSGCIPDVLAKYPQAKVFATPKGVGMLVDELRIPKDRLTAVADRETLSLGDRTLQFIHMPWVHWPETMVTLLPEQKLLFSCDLFGSHLSGEEPFADPARVYGPAKRYYAEIMMPFSAAITRHLQTLGAIPLAMILPSHGPIYNRPEWILETYRRWVTAPPCNLALLPFISMHGSTRMMVDHLARALRSRGVAVRLFDLGDLDLGEYAMSLVEAATVVVATPTVLGGPHPSALSAVQVTNALRPKLRYAGVIGSYGWAARGAETVTAALAGLKVEFLPAVFARGLPTEDDLRALDSLAGAIAERHTRDGLAELPAEDRPAAGRAEVSARAH